MNTNLTAGRNLPNSTHFSLWPLLLAIAALAGCSSKPPLLDWQLQSHASVQRATVAYLQGQDRTARAEWEQARKHLSSTGRADLLANAELVACAAKAASLVWEACTDFETLRADTTAAQQAYAAYLRGQLNASDAGLLPTAQRAAALASNANDAAIAVAAITDPLSRLVAAAVVLQSNKASPAMLTLAIDTASAQGWRRPLLAWLGVQALRAEQAGQPDEAARVRRRIDLVAGKR